MKIFMFFLVLSEMAFGLVTAPVPIDKDQWGVEFKAILERGKVEPNENKASYQKALIDIYLLGITKGLDITSFGVDHFLKSDFKYFTSAEEKVNGQLFYESDTGQSITLTYGFNFVHPLAYSSGMFISVSPLINFNKNKFSVPRQDLWNLGFRGGVELNSIFFNESSIQYGSGISNKQNSYIAFNHVFGAKLNSVISIPLVLKFGPYAELDTSERKDAAYDAAFSPAGSEDRIRSMKIGIITTIESKLTDESYVSAVYVQKLGGYDAPATQAFSLALGMIF